MKSKHLGFVAEPEMYEELRSIAKSEYRSLSNLLYRIVKNWLRRYSSKKKKEAQGR